MSELVSILTFIVATMLQGEVKDLEDDPRYEQFPELMEAIVQVCDGNRQCITQAVGQCWMESRCQMAPRGVDGSGACGPFQQLRRYADLEEFDGMSQRQVCQTLRTEPYLAAKQWQNKRERYMERHGRNWVLRYAGHTADRDRTGYQANLYRVARRVDRRIEEHISQVELKDNGEDNEQQ